MKYACRRFHIFSFRSLPTRGAWIEISHVYARIKGLPIGFRADAAKWAKESDCDMLQKPEEAWAEAWASYHTGINVDKVPDYILKYIKKVQNE